MQYISETMEYGIASMPRMGNYGEISTENQRAMYRYIHPFISPEFNINGGQDDRRR